MIEVGYDEENGRCFLFYYDGIDLLPAEGRRSEQQHSLTERRRKRDTT